MNPKISVFIATSLDGFIARADGGLDWLESADELHAHDGAEDYGYKEFIDTVDLLVMGRRTFEQVLTFPDWPYDEREVVVLSSRPLAIPAALAATVTWSARTPRDLVAQAAIEGATHLYVDGGVTIRRFLADGLIDEMTITQIPILLGEGIPLFGPIGGDAPLRHMSTRAFPNGYVQSKYRVERAR